MRPQHAILSHFWLHVDVFSSCTLVCCPCCCSPSLPAAPACSCACCTPAPKQADPAAQLPVQSPLDIHTHVSSHSAAQHIQHHAAACCKLTSSPTAILSNFQKRLVLCYATGRSTFRSCACWMKRVSRVPRKSAGAPLSRSSLACRKATGWSSRL